eukprot:1218342-Amorphochlora_amoeboformis.AAC.1
MEYSSQILHVAFNSARAVSQVGWELELRGLGLGSDAEFGERGGHGVGGGTSAGDEVSSG